MMVKISFLGDVSLNDQYNQLYEKGEDPFSELSPMLQNSDLVIGNLECVSKGEKGFNLLKKPRLYSNPNTLNYLKNINAGLLTLATNHVYDNLEDGFNKTLHILEKLNIKHIGCNINSESARMPIQMELGDIKFCILNYVTSDTNPSIPENAGIYPNEFSIEKCIEDLKKYSDAHYRIVIPHWGGRFEGSLFPGTDQRKVAKTLINNGADLIIGHHSHTLQPYEKYRNKYIFYSLGNFCFADIYSDGKLRKMSQKKFRESAIITISFDINKYSTEVDPIKNIELNIQKNQSFHFKIKWRNFIFLIFRTFPFIWKFNHFVFLKISPVIKGIFRSDDEKSITQRIKEFKFAKIKALVKK